jgi:hypothetical protein
MLSAGIVDPAKVVRVALQEAASIAGLLITTEAMVAEARRRNRRAAVCLAAPAVWAEWITDPKAPATAYLGPAFRGPFLFSRARSAVKR